MDPQERFNEDLEEWLWDAGRTVRYPPTPPLSTRVAARLRGQRAPRRGSQSWFLSGRRGVLAPRGVAVVLLLAALALAMTAGLFPPSRAALAEFFGLSRIEVVPTEGTPPVLHIPGILADLDTLAGRTTLVEARSQADFPIRLPAYPESLGEPDAVYFQDMDPGQQVVLVYLSRPGLKLDMPAGDEILFTLFQFRIEGIFQKQIFPETLVEELEVGGVRALWFQGTAHWLQYRNPEGNVEAQFKRPVEGNTLAWEVDDVTYRLETSLPREEAVKIAASLH